MAEIKEMPTEVTLCKVGDKGPLVAEFRRENTSEDPFRLDAASVIQRESNLKMNGITPVATTYAKNAMKDVEAKGTTESFPSCGPLKPLL